MVQEVQSTMSAGNVKRYTSTAVSHIVAFVFLAIVFTFFRLGWVPGVPAWNLSQLQMIFFPLLLMLLWRARVTPVGMPVQLLLVVAACGFLSIWLVHSVSSTGTGAFHVARLSDDPYEKHTRIFREGINEYLIWDDTVKAHRYWDAIESPEEARVLIENEGDIRLLIWGDQKRLRVSFGELEITSIGGLIGRSATTPLLDMVFVTQIPMVELPFGPQNAVREYTARLFSGLLPIMQDEVFIPSGMGMRHELDLRTAARVVSNWRTEDHRGFAWWVLANGYVKKGLMEPESLRGYFDCAKRAYEVAATYVSRGDSPELFASIHNNYAILLLLRRLLGVGKTPMKNALESLRYAVTAERAQAQGSGKLELFLHVRGNLARYGQLRDGFKSTSLDERSRPNARKGKKKKRVRAVRE